MKNWLGYTGLSLVALGALGFAALAASSVKANISENGSASVRLDISKGTGTCSATHLGAGRFLTAAHCLGHGDIQIKTDTGATAAAEILWGNKLYDLAMLRANVRPRSAAVDCSLVKSGSIVTATGNPLGMAFIRTPGVVVSGLQTDPTEVDGETIWPEHIVVDVTVAPGSSGGGLFNETGRLVGVVVGMALPFRYAFVVPSSTVCQFLGR